MSIKILLKKVISQKGAIDRVLVTLFLIVIGVLAVVGIEEWTHTKKNNLISKANTSFTKALE